LFKTTRYPLANKVHLPEKYHTKNRNYAARFIYKQQRHDSDLPAIIIINHIKQNSMPEIKTESKKSTMGPIKEQL
jgi:hypothetical protein